MGLVKTYVSTTPHEVTEMIKCPRYDQLVAVRVLLGITESGFVGGVFYLYVPQPRHFLFHVTLKFELRIHQIQPVVPQVHATDANCDVLCWSELRRCIFRPTGFRDLVHVGDGRITRMVLDIRMFPCPEPPGLLLTFVALLDY